MDELDRYLKIEDRDADYRRYQVRAHGSDLFKKIALVVRSWFRSRSETPARTDSTLGLAYGELSVWKVRHPVTLTCLEGNLWLTRTGDPKDYLLKAGESMTLKSGPWVLQALDPSFIQQRTSLRTPEATDGKATVFPVLQRV